MKPIWDAVGCVKLGGNGSYVIGVSAGEGVMLWYGRTGGR